MTAAAPSGVVTFLFTDIEGSTRRWEADAEAMRAALAAHQPHMSSGMVRRHDDGMVALMTGWLELRLSPGLRVELVCGSLQPWPQRVGV
jgi:hypothetical protein